MKKISTTFKEDTGLQLVRSISGGEDGTLRIDLKPYKLSVTAIGRSMTCLAMALESLASDLREYDGKNKHALDARNHAKIGAMRIRGTGRNFTIVSGVTKT